MLEYEDIANKLIDQMFRFPFSRWGVIYSIHNRFHRRGADWLKSISELFDKFQTVWNRLQYQNSSSSRTIVRSYFLHLWTFNRQSLTKLTDPQSLDSAIKEMRVKIEEAKATHSRILFLKVVVDLSILASLLVYRSEEVNSVRMAYAQLQKGQFGAAYETCMKLDGKMSFIYLSSIIERAFVAAVPTVIGLFAFQTNAGSIVALLFLALIFSSAELHVRNNSEGTLSQLIDQNHSRKHHNAGEEPTCALFF